MKIKTLAALCKKAGVFYLYDRITEDGEVAEQWLGNMLMDQFGISGDEAFNLIAQGAQNGLDKNGDLLDSINEYSVHFKSLGLDAEDMFNSLANGAESGTFSVDKLGDAVKEFGIRVKDGTANDAFKQLGLDADATAAAFARGGDEASAAFAAVTDALFAMEDPLAQNALGVQMFGTMWEDLGAEGVKALTNLNGEISNTTDALGAINEVNVPSTLEATSGVLDATDAITDILKAAFPASAVVNIVDKVIDYAKVGAQKAEQLYIINTISKDERKEEATKFVYEALEIAGVERTAAIEKIVDGAVEAAVLTLGHTVDTDNHGEGYGEGIAE